MNRKCTFIKYLLMIQVFTIYSAEDEQSFPPGDAALQEGSQEAAAQVPAPEGAPPIEGGSLGAEKASAPLVWRTVDRKEPKNSAFRGNWFKKRTLVQDARVVYESIHTRVTEQWEPQLQAFLKQYEQSLARVSDALKKIPYSVERINELESQVKELDTERPMQLVTQAQKAFSLVRLIERSMQEIIAVLQKQIAMAASYEKDAWRLYEEIDTAYDDIAAAQAYATLQSMRDYSVNVVNEYLQKQLIPYAESLVRQYDETIKTFVQVKDGLKAYDIYVIPEEKPAPAKPTPAPEPVVANQRWYDWFMAPVWMVDDAFWSLYRWCVGWVR
jgi:rubrerythrin